MNTTLSTPPAGMEETQVEATTRGGGWQEHRRRPAMPLILVVGIAVLGSGAWAVASWLKSGGDMDEVDRFTVIPRTFTVALKEKGELKAAKSTDIICEVEGRTTIISLIAEGTAVQEGDLLVELASDKIEERISSDELKETNAITAFESAKAELEIQRDKNASDIRKAQLKIELNGLALEKYEQGDWKQQLKDADIAIERAQILLKRRKEDWGAYTKLYERKFITRTEYEESEFNHQKAQWDLERARMAKDVMVRYTYVAELRKRQSDLDEASKEADRVGKNAIAEETKKLRALEGAEKELSLIRDQLAKLRGQKQKCRITAPTQGFVVYHGGGGHWRMSQEPIKEGGEVHERQVLMQLPDTSEMMAIVRIHEAKTDKLRLDQPVLLTVEGVPGKQFTGRVTKIAVVADTQNRWLNPDLKEYETEITLDPTDVPLKPGVTAHVQIIVETVADRLAVPVQSVFSKGAHRYVLRERDGAVSAVPVRLGAASTEWVEILEGMADGDEILLALSDANKRLIPDVPAGERDGDRRPRATRHARSSTGGESTTRPAATAAAPKHRRHSTSGTQRTGGAGQSSRSKTQ